jgi:hypothetical protein
MTGWCAMSGIGAVRIAAGDDHVRAGLHEGSSGGEANPAGPTGHKDGAASHIPIAGGMHVHLPFVSPALIVLGPTP